MKTILKTLFILALISLYSCAEKPEPAIHYEANWESLKQAPIPEWMLDAKFGIYTHWGVYSVPAFESNTYAKEMYTPDSKGDPRGVKAHHQEKYGDVANFGYTDFIKMFKAEKFDAAEWVGVMKGSGAKFGGLCLVHHDGFALWDSEFTQWDAMDKGPKRDIYGEIATEIKKNDMKLAATFHHGRTFGWVVNGKDGYTQKQLDTWDIFKSEYADFYRDPSTEPKESFGNEWASKVREVIRKYEPDMLWFDGLAGSIKNDIIPNDTITSIFADYLNKMVADGKEGVIANKLPAGRRWNFPNGFGLRTYENARDLEKDPQGYWLSDRAISYPWSYVENKNYNLTSDHHIRSIVDKISRGGIFFLSLTPKGDGSIPDEEKQIMSEIGEWMNVNGEAIYSTRTWVVQAEGPTEMLERDERRKTHKWNFDKLTANDFRFTRSKDLKTLYTMVVGWPEDGKVEIKTLAKGNEHDVQIKDLSMLGVDEEIKWEQDEEKLTIWFPEEKPCEVAYSFKIDVKNKLSAPETDNTFPEFPEYVKNK